MMQTDLFDTLQTARENAGTAIARPGRSALDLEMGKRLAKKGAERAADHADQEEPSWSDRALEMLRRFLAEHPREHFICEDVREYAGKRGFSRPPDSRAWGAVMRRAAEFGLVVATGAWAPGRAMCHARPQRVWQGA